MKLSYAKQIIPSLLIFLFAYTAISKTGNIPLFKWQLSQFPFIGQQAAWFAFLVPGIEIIAVILLLLPATRFVGLYLSLLLLFLFTGYLVLMISTQNNLPCSCGGVIQKMSWQQHIVFNISFLILSVFGIYIERKKALPLLRNMKPFTGIAGTK